MNATLFLPGVGCMIAAAVGGGCKAVGVEIPAIQSVKRQLILGGIGLALIAASLGTAATESPPAGSASNNGDGERRAYSENGTLHEDEDILFHGLSVKMKGAATVIEDGQVLGDLADVSGELDGKPFHGRYKQGQVLNVSSLRCDFDLTFTGVDTSPPTSASASIEGNCKE